MKTKKKYKITDKERLTVQENTMNQLDTYFSIKGTNIHAHTFANKDGEKTTSGVTVTLNGNENRHPYGSFIIDSEELKQKVTKEYEIDIKILNKVKFLPLTLLGEIDKDAIVRTQRGGSLFQNSPALTFNEYDLSKWENALTLLYDEVYFIAREGKLHTIFWDKLRISDMKYYGRPLEEIYPQLIPIIPLLKEFLIKHLE